MPRIVDREAQRRDILERSFELFASRGYHAVSMRTLARQLGVSTGTLYHYFPNKQAIFEAMFSQLVRQDAETASRQIADAPDQGARLRRLFAFLQGRLGQLQNALLLSLDYLRQLEDEQARAFVVEVASIYRDTIREQLDLGDSGLDQLVFSLCLGAITQSLLIPEEDGLARQGEAAAALLGMLPGR